jgi:anthranilate synthase/aminodeoxychorismate synthase-like glutamine amidotransferase
MVVLIDNYDSFTYNLVQYVGELGAEVVVVRNDETSIDDIDALTPSHLIVSPGPGNPDTAGISLRAIEFFTERIPVLGVCLGHQCLAQSLGGVVRRADRLMHGKVSAIYHHAIGLFQGLSSPFDATRYHSLIVDESSLPERCEVTAYTSDGEVMAIQAKGRPVYGVQFHPESILTDYGRLIMKNFLSRSVA